MIGKQRADAEEARLKMEQSRLKLELEQRKAELAKQKVKALEQEVKEAAAVCDLNVKASTRALRDSLATVQASRVGQLSTEQQASADLLHKRLEEIRIRFEQSQAAALVQKDSIEIFRKILKEPTLRNNPAVNETLIKANIIKLPSKAQADSIANVLKAKLLPNYTETAEKIDIPMIYVESGSFTMGCHGLSGGDCLYDELPAHAVTIDSFYIGKTEITQKQWRAVMGRSPNGLFFGGCDECPVENVSWDDIQLFLKRLNKKTGKTYRLPTEAEWEFAARGGNKSANYKYSGGNSIDDVAWSRTNSQQKTNPVASRKPNELGIYDMTGNVWEWCADYFNRYPPALQTNPNSPDFNAYRVLRGGSWSNKDTDCRIPFRNHGEQTYRYGDDGFRIVLGLVH